jgi:ADP-ribosylglycohydrolase
MKLQDDYLERVYAGVLGKLIGVYLGRPFEGWTYDRIMKELGTIEYYVHKKLGDPLVITDDDVAGTFTFLRALEDYDLSENLKSEDIGKAWMNYIVEKRSILWWGGNGNSSEHTAWLNLRKGIPAPKSGSIETNGLTVAEQIGAQIFIDGWALVAPGQPVLAAKFAKEAGSVSHDGESVFAAMLWAAMEAEAFRSKDIDHLLDTGLSFIPANSELAAMIKDVRKWHSEIAEWRDCRQKIADNYGYDKYHGNCHVMPNHAIMVMTMLYAPEDFSLGQAIINTSGWDTDCNAGNVGCLHGIMFGLDGLSKDQDWRGPIADRMLISSADGGNSINDAVKMSYYIANLGKALAGETLIELPKGGAQYHFSLAGAQQGFQLTEQVGGDFDAHVQGTPYNGIGMLEIGFNGLTPAGEVVTTTPTFTPLDVLRMRTYDLMATPLIYSGQTLTARVISDADTSGDITVKLRIRHYGEADQLVNIDSDPINITAGSTGELSWQVPECGSQPIAEIGLVISSVEGEVTGRTHLDRMGWTGPPELTLRRPNEPSDFWHRAWVNSADIFSKRFPESFHISQDRGEGLIIHGTRQWTDYKVTSDVVVHLGQYAGLTARTQGLRRYYGARISKQGLFEIVRTYDDETEVLASATFEYALDDWVPMSMTVLGTTVTASAGKTTLTVDDTSNKALENGGIGLMVADGAASANVFRVTSAT